MSNVRTNAKPSSARLGAGSDGGVTLTREVSSVRLSPPKQSINDLALFGGVPAFEEVRLVGRPNLPPFERLTDFLREVYENRWLTNRGPLLQQFEDQVGRRSGAKHCIAVGNATLGLQCIAQALELSGDVLMPAFTFIATAHAFRSSLTRPVFVDVDRQTHQIDVEQVARAIGPQTGAIVGVHLWGEACATAELEELARRHRLPLVFDAAHAFGCTHQSRPIGSHGVAEVFSFHATKFVNTFEGGAICTNDDALAQRLRQIINFGFGDGETTHSLGTNAKMSEASAAMGLASLEIMDEIVATNRSHFETYRSLFSDQPALRVYPYHSAEARNYQYAVFEWMHEDSVLTRDELLKVLAAENVVARRYFAPGLHRHQPYAAERTDDMPSLPVTEELSHRVFLLPTGTALSTEEVSTIGRLVRLIADHADAVRDKIRA